MLINHTNFILIHRNKAIWFLHIEPCGRHHFTTFTATPTKQVSTSHSYGCCRLARILIELALAWNIHKIAQNISAILQSNCKANSLESSMKNFKLANEWFYNSEVLSVSAPAADCFTTFCQHVSDSPQQSATLVEISDMHIIAGNFKKRWWHRKRISKDRKIFWSAFRSHSKRIAIS